jgi:hypothetical protein
MTRPAHGADPVAAVMRPPQQVMRLARIGAFHQTRLSFVRTLVRRMGRESWRFTVARHELDADGYGTIVYRIETPAGRLSFVAFSTYLAPEERTDRVIAEKWDTAFALVAGEADAATVARLRQSVPAQEAGRFSAGELVLSRANRSVRLFDRVIQCLAAGHQPPLAELLAVGYLLRTTAVYGNGKFGIADLDRLWGHGLFALPYQAEMLTVYMARQLGFDLVEHIARQRSARAVPLDAASRRALGVGNATGLGMAPFLVGHPKLLNAWISARETALARVRVVEAAEAACCARFAALLARARRHAAQWHTDDPLQQARIATLRVELDGLQLDLSDPLFLAARRPWDFLYRRAADRLGLEAQEMLVSLLIEVYPELVDDLEMQTGADEAERLVPDMRLADLQALIELRYDWALAQSYDAPEARYFFWYRSAEKDEPRLGERFNEAGAELELPIGIGCLVSALHREVSARAAAAPDEPVAHFLLGAPRWRGIVRRVQSLADLPYAEIRDNLIGAACRPIDLLRCKLSVFGASKFDPKSDRWTRITLFQGAPPIEALGAADADDWLFPGFPG